MKDRLGYLGIGLVIAIFLFGVYASTTIQASTTPVKVDVYFLTLGKSGNLVAYVPGRQINVGVKIDSSITKPYIEVSKAKNKPKMWETNGEEFIVWGSGGTLYVKDVQQVKNLLLVQ